MYFIIEKSGEQRQMWGPYGTVKDASAKCGARHVVITGTGLSDGQTMTRGELQAALQSGRIRIADDSDQRVLA